MRAEGSLWFWGSGELGRQLLEPGGEASPVCCIAQAMFDFLKNSLSNLYKAAFFEAAKHVNLSNFAMGIIGKGEKFASYVDAFDKMISLMESMYNSSTPPSSC